MYTSYNIFVFPLFILLTLSCFLSCSDDDDELTRCDIIKRSGVNFQFNEETVWTVDKFYTFRDTSQFFVNQSHLFNIKTFRSTCDILEEITLNVDLEPGQSIEGVFEISSNVELNKANGNILTRIIEDVEETRSFFESGTLEITQLSEREFRLVLDAILQDGTTSQFDVSSDF